MSNTKPTCVDDPSSARRGLLGLLGLTAFASVGQALAQAPSSASDAEKTNPMNTTVETPLTARQLAIGPIAATAAVGDIPGLGAALDRGLDAGLSIGDTKEILVQLYAYAGFPRSLNALAELMKVVEQRRGRGLQDSAGALPGPIPTGQELLALGTANQTKLSGAPVRGPLFEFAPAIDQYLKTHLFGDIFARDNLDWQSRELATVAVLASMTGTESQLAAHLRISMNVGLSAGQLRQFAQALTDAGLGTAGAKVSPALDRLAAAASKP